MAPKSKSARKKLIPVDVDTKTRWGSTKAKQADVDLGRKIRNVLAEMGIEQVKIADAFAVGNAMAAKVDDIAATLKVTVQYVEGHEAELVRVRERLVQIVEVLEKLAQPVVEVTPPPTATGTSPPGIIHSLRYLCSCGLVMTTLEQVGGHHHAVRRP